MCERGVRGLTGLFCLIYGGGILLTLLFRGVLLTAVAAIALCVAGAALLRQR